MAKIRVVLADDHVVVRNGIKMLLENEGEIEVIGEASNGEEALEVAQSLKPDVLILDIRMPIMTGLEASSQLHSISPTTKVLILSMHNDEEYIIQSVECGASGYLLKDTSKDEFIKAIRTVHQGGKYFSGDISKVLVDSYLQAKGGKIANPLPNSQADYELTKREKEILSLIYQGMANKDIADQLNKSIRTIETHRFNIMKKLKVNNVVELLKKVEEERVLE
ncbi:response regulator transcription factor [Pleomorphovibrio marinus]|uniref:response regulator transcription factor n=1 Tax=Pleomorphovibrio marinus TaxID=2164132 RepID=UPI000E0A06B1|nr:response regulator transcription factor [Pleomorphovibrio marinus]